MELFASAGQESTERSRFIGLISSLEPLAELENYTDEMLGVIERFQGQIKELKLSPNIKASLLGRIVNLSTESVRSAIRRVVKEALPDDSEALRIIEDAYNLRSRILHNGTTNADLNQKGREIEGVIRRIIASRIALNLRIS